MRAGNFGPSGRPLRGDARDTETCRLLFRFRRWAERLALLKRATCMGFGWLLVVSRVELGSN